MSDPTIPDPGIDNTTPDGSDPQAPADAAGLTAGSPLAPTAGDDFGTAVGTAVGSAVGAPAPVTEPTGDETPMPVQVTPTDSQPAPVPDPIPAPVATPDPAPVPSVPVETPAAPVATTPEALYLKVSLDVNVAVHLGFLGSHTIKAFQHTEYKRLPAAITTIDQYLANPEPDYKFSDDGITAEFSIVPASAVPPANQ